MNKELARKKYLLSVEQKRELTERYYDGAKTKQLIEDFNLHGLQPSQITYLFDNIITDNICEYCNVPMEKEPATHTSPNKDIICPQCGHVLYNSQWKHCSCANCRSKADEQKKTAEDLKKKAINQCLKLEHKKDLYKSDSLTSWEKLLLGALIEFTMDEELEYIQPLEKFSRTLLSDGEKSLNILKELFRNGILILGNKYHTTAFIFNEDFEVQSYMVNRVFYEIWLDDEDVITELLNPTPFLNPEQILSFWKDFNKAEAIKFLLNEFKKIKINNFIPGKKTEEVFSAMVERFSLSQIFRMIKYITDKTAKEVISGEKYYQHAANATISRLESYYKRALYENYSLYNVRYENDLSMITTYFYNKILNMGDSAFYSVPNMELKLFTILASKE